MATIKVRKQANGSTRYTAIVRIRQSKTIIHRESKTFAFRAAAGSWAKYREVELEKPGELERARQAEMPRVAIIRRYIDSFARFPNGANEANPLGVFGKILDWPSSRERASQRRN
jgi:hypothetical protein